MRTFEEIQKLSKKNFYLMEVSFKDFKEILDINFENNLIDWHQRYLDGLSVITNIKEFDFYYPSDYTIKNDNNEARKYIWDWSKYYYFCRARLKTYRVPLNIVGKNNSFYVHPGNARVNCMSWWKDHYRVKIFITDNNLGEILIPLAKKSAYVYNFQKHKDWLAITDVLDFNNWKSIFLRYNEITGYELGEQHCATKEFNQGFHIKFTPTKVIVNDYKVFSFIEGIPTLHPV